MTYTKVYVALIPYFQWILISPAHTEKHWRFQKACFVGRFLIRDKLLSKVRGCLSIMSNAAENQVRELISLVSPQTLSGPFLSNGHSGNETRN